MTTEIGLLLFPRLTQLDLTGPAEVLGRLPDARVRLVWKTTEPVASDTGLRIVPTDSFESCPGLDVLCVPGGSGVDALLEDEAVLSFVRRQGAAAHWVTSVCTGALLLGAAGLLQGYKAATHWTAMAFLPAFGAEPVKQRVCIDRNRITGGGVTAGIDFGLQLAAEIAGRETAERIQLSIEYDPAPPFRSGSPDVAAPDLLDAYRKTAAPWIEARGKAVARAAARLG